MNQQIKQLYEQAGLTINNPMAYEQWYLDSLEKFAESLIEDCIRTLRNNGYDDAAECLHDVHFGMDDSV